MAGAEDPAIEVAECFLAAFIAGDREALLVHGSEPLRWFGRTVALGSGAGQTPSGPWSSAEIGSLRRVPEVLTAELDPIATEGAIAATEALILADLEMAGNVVTLALVIADARVTKVIDPEALKVELERLGRGDG